MSENSDLERKLTLDPDEPKDRLKLVREIVAMVNSGGGLIEIGVADDGTDVGVSRQLAAKFDPARLGDMVESYVSPDRVELTIEQRSLPGDELVIEIAVPRAPDPPLVLRQAGNYVDGKGRQSALFPAQSVYVRRNTKAEPANREDYRQWREEAVQRARNEILERLTMVVEAPPDARIRVIDEEEVKDEPNFFLSRSADVFSHRPERLLSGQDLAYLWIHRHSLDASDVANELIFQSALRKRATLFLWLAFLDPEADRVGRYLMRALDMRDRDKSDAARSILLVAALYLSDVEYERIRQAMAASSYAHMREQAEALPVKTDAQAVLDAQRRTTAAGQELAELTVDEIKDMAEELLRSSDVGLSRRVPPLGWEYLRRSRGR